MDKNIIRCSNCRKMICEGTMNDGRISIKCKCGTISTITATPKPTNGKYIYNQPYQNRLNLVKK